MVFARVSLFFATLPLAFSALGCSSPEPTAIAVAPTLAPAVPTATPNTQVLAPPLIEKTPTKSLTQKTGQDVPPRFKANPAQPFSAPVAKAQVAKAQVAKAQELPVSDNLIAQSFGESIRRAQTEDDFLKLRVLFGSISEFGHWPADYKSSAEHNGIALPAQPSLELRSSAKLMKDALSAREDYVFERSVIWRQQNDNAEILIGVAMVPVNK